MLLTALALAGIEVMPRAPHAPQVAAGEALLFGPTFVSFTRLELGTPLAFGGRGRLGVGVTARAGVTHLRVPAEERSHTQLQHVGGGVWALFQPRTPTHHAFGLTFAMSPRRGGLYGFVAQDAASRFVTFGYRLDHRDPPYRFALAIDSGFDDVDVFHSTLVPTFAYALRPRVEVEVTGVLGIQPLVAGGLGLRIGPLAGFELGAGVFAVVGFERGVPVHPMPQLTLRYTGRWKKRFAASNPWGEALEQREREEGED